MPTTLAILTTETTPPSKNKFRDTGAALSHNVMHDLAAGVAITTPNAYIGMYAYPGEECGRSMVLHSVARFPRGIGRPTPWDARTYAYIQDVVEGEIVSVSLPSAQFERTPTASSTQMSQAPTPE